jgi:peptidoglycan-associated lipoprotein
MLNKMFKVATVAITVSLLSACGSKEKPSMTNNMNNMSGGANHSQGDNGNMSNITPGSLEDYRQNVGDRVFFDTAEYILSAEAKNTLHKQAKWLKQYASNRTISVEGHADERGTREYNIALGAKRANSVRSYLVSQGLPTNSFSVVSYGKERPEVEGSDAHSWAKNRRVVVNPQ